MSSELKYGQILEYHEEFILNPAIVSEFDSQKITPSSGERKVYFKRPDEDLICIVGVNPETPLVSFKAAGEGTMIVDWGDNSTLEYFNLTTKAQTIEHYFDNVVDKRRIRFYGDTKLLKFTKFDTTNLGGALMVCKPIIVDEYTCIGRGFSLMGLALLDGTYKVDLQQGGISNLLPIGDMNLQELNLTDVHFVTSDVLDDYLEYIVAHYGDRRPCTVWISSEPTDRGYAAINTILNEPEWNVSDSWKFYINNQLYQQSNDTDTE